VLKRALLIGLGLLFIAAGFVGGAVLTSGGSDDFRFVGGRRPLAKGIVPIMEDAGRPTRGWTWQYRTYSWHEPFKDVVRKAQTELLAEGFTHDVELEGFSGWGQSDDRMVTIRSAESRNRSEAVKGEGRKDAAWVTVTVYEPIQSTWLNHLRYALEPP
jgi:hypothetical protein